ncbi:FtsX-like permease family protein [Fulvimonas sp. R45]|uniref:ABC transporter permease n=1 Tax=Fulvimonas sp. R45 TaxID=3045937 RepID=UPI00265E48C5|nr:FtsX-like permease family protein [Fulvimonas sp. R45]MDO1528244.1 FtsX-like permease family protein [Fulvimonas sp. R45]
MELRPILATLRRHKVILWLLMLEIALSCAIICNGVFLVAQRLQHMDMPSGIAEHELVQIQQAPIAPPSDRYARAQEDLATLRAIPGVQAVGMSNQVPFGGASSNGNVMLSPTQPHRTLSAAEYFGENLVQTLGLRLVAGRDLRPDEYVDADVVIRELASGSGKGFPVPMIVSQALATRLWPQRNPLGRLVWLTPTASFRVVGVVRTLARANAYDTATAQYSMIIPLHMGADKDQSYLLRTRPQDRQRVLAAATAALKRADPTRVVTHARTYDRIRSDYFKDDHATAGMLVSVIVAVLLVTGLGIVGLASFWVAQRRRQIGIRRALGARRADILHYFQTENFLIVTFGIVLGMVLAYGISLFLMMRYELPRLPAGYFPVGALVLWGIGQLAVLGPALRAAAVPPVVATRSV